jgi:hypothetical protein
MFDREKIQFMRALDALIDYHNLMREKMTPLAAAPVAAAPKKQNSFISFMEHVGHDLKVGLPKALIVAESAGEVAVDIFAPGASALFNQTVAAVSTAEQAAVVAVAQNGPPVQKLASVVAIMGPIIKQALTDVGKPNDDASVQKYVSAVVTILNAVPVAVESSTQLPVPSVDSTQLPVPSTQQPVPATAKPSPTTVVSTSSILGGPSAMEGILP